MRKLIKSKRSYKDINALMGKGLYLMFKEGGPEPNINKWRLGRRSGISYKVIKTHCRGGLVTSNIQNIVADFRDALQRYSNPGVLSLNMVKLVKVHRFWFEIEEARKSFYLYESMAKALEQELTRNWIHLSEPTEVERYKIFWLKFHCIVAELSRKDFSDESLKEAEAHLCKVLQTCATASLGGLISC